MPSVSVVVPTFNAGRLLEETLDSVEAQTLPPLEIIVIDDGSTDDTVERVHRRAPRVRLVTQANRGVSSARNRGWMEAQGDLLCFLDQDDVWHPMQLERQAACLHAIPAAAAVATPYWFCRADGALRLSDLVWPADPGGANMVDGYEGWTYHRFLLDCWALTSATMIRRQALVSVGGFDESLPYSEDWDLWLRLSRQAPFVQLAWPPVKYRQHAVQGSRQVRQRDYRCELLTRTAREHGLCSPDGKCITAGQFRGQLAHYKMEYGYHLASAGLSAPAAAALFTAWCMQPSQLKWLGLSAAVAVGWRPRWAQGDAA